MKKEVKTLRNKSKESLIVRIDWVKKEIKAWATFETHKAKELLRLYKEKFELVEKASKNEVKKEEVKKEEVKEKKISKK